MTGIGGPAHPAAIILERVGVFYGIVGRIVAAPHSDGGAVAVSSEHHRGVLRGIVGTHNDPVAAGLVDAGAVFVGRTDLRGFGGRGRFSRSSAVGAGAGVAVGAAVSAGMGVSSGSLPEEMMSPGIAGVGVASAGSVLAPSWANAPRGSRPIRSSAIKSRGNRCLIFFT